MPEPDYRLTVLSGTVVPMDARLQEFLGYWRGRRGDRAMPRRADIDPIGIAPHLLPNLFLTDVVDGGARFRFRLVGTAAVSGIGADLTGRYVDEVNESGRYRDYITALYRRVVSRRQPIFSMSQFYRFGDGLQLNPTTQRLMCPLSSDGDNVDMVFSCQVFALPSASADFPRLTADNPFASACEAAVE